MPISRSLRSIVLVDAATCAAMGALLVLGHAGIAQITRIPSPLLWYAGLALFPIAAFMAAVATRTAPPPAAVRLIVLGNVLWVAGSLLLLVGGWIAPNGLGRAFVLGQALVVAALAGLEHKASQGPLPRLSAG
ncbi:MAG TPA: hypothetical protein VFG43_01730 [Geminicoccaceae bacterium]|nr:hypothetical protein [Geminicoccaceae bacterium]